MTMQLKHQNFTYMTEGWPPKPDNWEEIQLTTKIKMTRTSD